MALKEAAAVQQCEKNLKKKKLQKNKNASPPHQDACAAHGEHVVAGSTLFQMTLQRTMRTQVDRIHVRYLQ